MKKSTRGFTLIELITVTAICCIAGAILWSIFNPTMDEDSGAPEVVASVGIDGQYYTPTPPVVPITAGFPPHQWWVANPYGGAYMGDYYPMEAYVYHYHVSPPGCTRVVSYTTINRPVYVKATPQQVTITKSTAPIARVAAQSVRDGKVTVSSRPTTSSFSGRPSTSSNSRSGGSFSGTPRSSSSSYSSSRGSSGSFGGSSRSSGSSFGGSSSSFSSSSSRSSSSSFSSSGRR